MERKENINLQFVSAGSIFDDLGIDDSICSLGSEGGFCSSKPIVKIIKEFDKVLSEDTSGGGKTQNPIIKRISSALDVSDEVGILTNPEFVVFAKRKGVTEERIKEELNTRFKPVGPRDSLKLIDNYNIFSVQSQWMREFPHYFAFDFAMIDFDKTNDPLFTTDIADILQGKVEADFGDHKEFRKCDCISCVLNTDVSTGRGKHWICVFVDCRSPEWTIEFYNSTGRPPAKSILRWMEKTYASLRDYSGLEPKRIIVTTVKHQQKNTECGVYSLFYIRKRLDGVPYTFFMKDRIDDDSVSEFRKYLFRPSSS